MNEQRIKDQKRQNKVASRTFAPDEPVRMKTADEITTQRREKRTSASVIAGDTFCKVNFYHPALKEYFPGNGKLWTVDKYYPYAKGGPLFIDEPRFEYSIRSCEQKLEAFDRYFEKMKKTDKDAKPVRYLILHNGVEPLNDCEGIEVIGQLVGAAPDYTVNNGANTNPEGTNT